MTPGWQIFLAAVAVLLVLFIYAACVVSQRADDAQEAFDPEAQRILDQHWRDL